MYEYIKIKGGDIFNAIEILRNQGIEVEKVDAVCNEYAKDEIDYIFDNNERVLREAHRNAKTSLRYEDYIVAAQKYVESIIVEGDSAFDVFHDACSNIFNNCINDYEEIEELHDLEN